jgi:sugar phosphate isomerase/epimerase
METRKLKTGLVSITFRQLPPREIIELAASARLEGIEWGGDVHVPPTDLARAGEVARLTREAGLSVAAYGSYYRLGQKERIGPPFAAVLETAVALGAPTIRVWAGVKGANETSASERRDVVDDALRIASLAEKQKMTISLEYHAGTLTDDRESVQLLMSELPTGSIQFLWQPANGETREQNLLRLSEVSPRMGNVHIFHWWPTAQERRALLEGEDDWLAYLRAINALPGNRFCLLEFVRGDHPRQAMDDAATLNHWIHKRLAQTSGPR